ncbi:hypothetical protein LH384_33845, partial [Pseudomonas aeruginosa]|nr:hypothetical protein [Pseudomonas aeruginosa]
MEQIEKIFLLCVEKMQNSQLRFAAMHVLHHLEGIGFLYVYLKLRFGCMTVDEIGDTAIDLVGSGCGDAAA